MSEDKDANSDHGVELPDLPTTSNLVQENLINQQKDTPKDEGERDDYPVHAHFKSYGYFGMWILPTLYLILFYGTIVFARPLLLAWIILAIASIGYEIKFGKNLPYIGEGIYKAAQITFGFEPEKENPDQIRLWWFILTVPFLSSFIVTFFVYTIITIIPLILLATKRDEVIAKIFSLTFLPRSKLVTYGKPAIKDEQKEILSHSSQYFQFYGNTKKRLTNAILTILGITLILSLLPFFAIRLSVAIDERSILSFYRPLGKNRGDNFDRGIFLNSLIWGIIAMIPYFIWSFPGKPKYRLTRLMGSKLGKIFVKSAATSILNRVPWFSGDYYVELNSRVLDLDDSYSFFEILKRGRLFPVVFTPIAFMSVFIGNAVRKTVRQLQNEGSSVDPVHFWPKFNQVVFATPYDRGIFGFFLILGPILFSILLPLILALHDAEIKRAVWEYDETIGITDEITRVEDLGITVNNLVSAGVGIGTVASIYFFLNGLGSGTIGPLVYTAVIIGISGVLILPGVFLMVYYYMWSGDHAYAVNYLRYHLSHDPSFGVGTITKEYFINRTLDPPPKHIADNLGL